MGNFFNLLRKKPDSEKKGHFEKKLKHLITEFHSIESHYRKLISLYDKPIDEKSIQEFQETKERGLFETENLWSELSKGRKSIPRDMAKPLVAFAKDMENEFTKATFPPSKTNVTSKPATKDSERNLAKKFLEENENYKIHLQKKIQDLLGELSK